MTTKVGINGFGRIGRQVLKAIRDMYPKELEVVAFNDIGDMKTMAHLLKYDTNYGRFDGSVEVVDGDDLMVDGKKVKAFKEMDPAAIPWGRPGRGHRDRSAPACSPSRKTASTRKARPSRARSTTSPRAARRRSSSPHLPKAKT